MKNSIPAGVKFIHLRRYKNWWTKINDDYDIYEPKGGTTIAYLMYPTNKDFAKVGIAECSEKDHYNKKIGRQIAMARLAKGQTVEISNERGALPLVTQIISQVVK